jgi:hypothetical protein
MPRLTNNRVPSYRLHKQSGQAIVTLGGKDHLLGQLPHAADRAVVGGGLVDRRAEEQLQGVAVVATKSMPSK